MLVIIIVNKDIHSILKIRYPSEDLNIHLCAIYSNRLSFWNDDCVLHYVHVVRISRIYFKKIVRL